MAKKPIVTPASVALPDGTVSLNLDPNVDLLNEFRKAQLEVMINRGKASTPFIFGRFLERQFENAVLRPDSFSAKRLTNDAEEIIRKGMSTASAKEISEQKVGKVWRQLSPKQRDIIWDMANKKTLVAGRRSGKTAAIGAFFWILSLSTDEEDHRHCLYLEQSMSKAYRELWESLCFWGRLIGETPRGHGGKNVTLGDNLTVWFGGHSKITDIDRWRGKKLSVIIVDEVQSVKSSILEQMVTKVLVATQATYHGLYGFYDTCFVLSGTPSYQGAGAYVRSFFNNPDWKRYHMTIWDNPGVKDPDAVARDFLSFLHLDYELPEDKRGIARYEHIQDVTFRKEILGDLDAQNLDTVVFPAIKTQPVPETWTKDVVVVGGIDYGYSHGTAIVLFVLDWDPASISKTVRGDHYSRKKMWAVKSFVGYKMTPSIVREKIKEFAAYGRDVYVRAGDLVICEGNECLVRDLNEVRWTKDAESGVVLTRIDADQASVGHFDVFDAARYGFYAAYRRLHGRLADENGKKLEDMRIPMTQWERFSAARGNPST